ncbi:MAG: VWA domain-containing protein [Oscillospiraceae bacterium]|nr:VWA domain-containing protein [Ruminococcus sp.]MBR0485672.1 VWA domain-containing protein [Oscillospiraceae bacterium]
MGLFDFLKSKKQQVSQELQVPQPQAPTVNLTKNPVLNQKISLRKEIVAQEVKKQNISVNIARVVFVLDHSGSMRNMYKDGTVQNVLERIFPIAMHFDDNAEMEFYWFDNLYKELDPVNYDTIDGYVQNVILSKNEHFGGTCYAPVMQEILNRYAKREPMKIPTFVIFITDGNNSDKKATKTILTEASQYNIFWKFVGIGDEKFDFLMRLDDMKGRLIDNANFVSVNQIGSISDSVLYQKLLTEYSDWLNLCKQNHIPVNG